MLEIGIIPKVVLVESGQGDNDDGHVNKGDLGGEFWVEEEISGGELIVLLEKSD